jgi:hypothetical protein
MSQDIAKYASVLNSLRVTRLALCDISFAVTYIISFYVDEVWMTIVSVGRMAAETASFNKLVNINLVPSTVCFHIAVNLVIWSSRCYRAR